MFCISKNALLDTVCKKSGNQELFSKRLFLYLLINLLIVMTS